MTSRSWPAALKKPAEPADEVAAPLFPPVPADALLPTAVLPSKVPVTAAAAAAAATAASLNRWFLELHNGQNFKKHELVR